MTLGRDARLAILLAGITFVAHLAFFVAVFGGTAPLAGDTPAYREPALNLLAGRGYTIDGVHPTANRPPGYALFLAATYALGGDDRAAVLAQFVVMSLVAAALYLLARTHLPRAESAVASLLLSLHVDVLFWSSFALSDSLALAVLVAAVGCAVAARRGGSAVLAGAGGALLGVDLLIRPSYLATLPAMALFLAIGVPRARAVRALVAFLVAGTLLLAPWTVRNAVTLGGFYPLSTEGGINLYAGTVWDEDILHVDDSFEPEVGVAIREMSETEVDRYLRERAVDRILDDPLGYFGLGLRKLWVTWQPTYARFSTVHQVVDVLCYAALIGGTALFLLRRVRPSPLDLLMAGLFVSCNGLIALTYADPEFRYRLPALLPLAWFAAQGWVPVVRRWMPRGAVR